MIGVVAMAVGMGTYAYFSDTETSTGNTFTAGTLDLKVDGMDDPNVETYFTITNVKPGDSGSQTIQLKNVGTVPEPNGPPWTSKVFITISKTLDDDVSCPEPEEEVDTSCGCGENGELDDYLDIRVRDYYDPSCSDNLRFDETHNLSVWDSMGKTFLNDDMPAGDVNCVVIDWSVDSGVGNIIQSDSVGFNITFTLEQTAPWP